MDKLDGMSLNVEQAEIDKLRTVFPQCFNEGKLDLSKLLALLGEYDDNDFEKYKFEWKGKSESLRLAQTRSMGTLRPAPAESVDWDTTKNVYIEGDNLEVLKLLQTDYYRRIKMIYIDPPYNTGHDFVYEDDFKDPLAKYKEITGQATKSNPETMGRFHTAWLNMMYPRLRLASNLLTDDGVIFISIDDNEITNLRKLCDEVFGEENFVGCFVWKRRTSSAMDQSKASTDHEYVLLYHKGVFSSLRGTDKDYSGYSNPDNDPRGPWTTGDLTVGMNGDMRPNQFYDLVDPKTGKVYKPNFNRVWSYAPDSMQKLIDEGRVIFPDDTSKRPMRKRFANELNSDTNPFSTWMSDVGMNTEGTRSANSLFDNMSMFNYAKPLSLVKALIQQSSSNDDIILDFFSGSGTTAHAVMQLNAEDGGNRKFIMVQLPEQTDEKSEANKAGFKNICEIGKERIRRAGAKIKSEWETEQAKRNAGLFAAEDEPQSAPDTGFKVFKLDTSNLKTWDSTPVDKNDAQQMDLLLDRMNDMIDTIKNDRSDLDIVYEVILKMGGVDLTDPVREVEVEGKRAYTIGENDEILLCLQEGLTAEIIEKMADEFIPSKIILSEKCFTDDTAMANAHYILKEREIELKLV